MSSTRALHRLLALALAGLWAVLPMVGALHDTEHAHRYCAEHGAVEEAGPTAGRAEDTAAGGYHAAEVLAADVHAACGLFFAHRMADGAAPCRAAVQTAGDTHWGAPRAPDGHVEARGLPILAAAPKGSPPAA